MGDSQAAHRLLPILGTYVRRPVVDVNAVQPMMGIFCLVISSLLAIPGRWRVDNSLLWMPTFGMGIAFVAFGIWGRLRQHLLSERRRFVARLCRPASAGFLAALIASLRRVPVGDRHANRDRPARLDRVRPDALRDYWFWCCAADGGCTDAVADDLFCAVVFR